MELGPYLYNYAMKPLEKKTLDKLRKNLVQKADGEVLEIGAGTGVNFSYYDPKKLKSLTVMDLKLTNYIKNYELNSIDIVDYIEGNVEKLPFDDNSFDSVVATLIFCSVDNIDIGLKEVYRVLKPGGKMYFIEHVLPEREVHKNFVNTINSTWKIIGKCNLNRETLKHIKNAKFSISEYERIGDKLLVFIAGIGTK